jgi:hypothetical protein
MALVLIAVLALPACGGQLEVSTTTTEVATTSSTTTTVTVPATTTSVAETDAQDEIDWFVAVLNGGELTESVYEEKFTESFRQEVTFDEGIQPVLDQFRPAGPFTVAERSGNGPEGEAIIEAADGTRIRVLAELDDQGRFAALLLQPADSPTVDNPPESLGEAFDRLAGLGTLGATTAEIIDGECTTLEEVQANEPIPLGSMFKLYVLAALGEAVGAGEISWDDELVIRDELKSIPTGVLQDRPAGDTVTVLEAAELMISISDNTASDHLIDLLGREDVELAMAEFGHTAPELNTPLMTTRELVALKIGPASGLYVQWLEGDEQTRRDILRRISDITPGDLPLQEWTQPIHPDTVEWFASPDDLCTLAVRLLELSETVPELASILSLNPGIPAEPGTWDEVWFKGGSEPGLEAVWWVTDGPDGTFVTTGSVVNPDQTFDSEEAILLFAAGRDLLAP